MELSCIIIYDNTASANVLFASESVHGILGFRPEELTGSHGYKLTHPDERASIGVIHNANVAEERMSSLTTYRSLCKDETYVELQVIVHYCYDTLVTTNFKVTSKDSIQSKMRSNTADFVHAVEKNGSIKVIGAWRDSKERSKRLLESRQPWGGDDKVEQRKQEPRFCLVLNRFTEKATIVFGTKICEELVGLNQFDCIGKSLYDFVAPQDVENVSKQIELSKSKNIISRLRFDWKLDRENSTVAVEAVISCTYDGLVMVTRLAPSSITSHYFNK